MFSLLKKIAKFALQLASLYLLLGVLAASFMAALMVPVHLIGQHNRPRGVRLLVRAIRILRQLNRFNTKPKTQAAFDFFEMVVLLGKGASWEQIHTRAQHRDEQGNITDHSNMAFSFYIVEERYEDAYEAALAGCKATEEKVAGREDEMRRFFREEGTDFIARNQALMKEYEKRCEEYKVNPQSPPPKIEAFSKDEFIRTMPFKQFYGAHLALEFLRWMQTLDSPQKEHAKALISTSHTQSFAWIPNLRIHEQFVREAGMDESTLSAIRQRIIGSETS